MRIFCIFTLNFLHTLHFSHNSLHSLYQFSALSTFCVFSLIFTIQFLFSCFFMFFLSYLFSCPKFPIPVVFVCFSSFFSCLAFPIHCFTHFCSCCPISYIIPILSFLFLFRPSSWPPVPPCSCLPFVPFLCLVSILFPSRLLPVNRVLYVRSFGLYPLSILSIPSRMLPSLLCLICLPYPDLHYPSV